MVVLQVTPERGRDNVDAVELVASSQSLIFSVKVRVNRESNRTLMTFLNRRESLKGKGTSRKKADELKDEIGEEHRTSAQNKFAGYLNGLESALRNFEDTRKDFSPAEKKEVRSRMEEEVNWLAGEFIMILKSGRRAAESAVSMDELDAAFDKMSDALHYMNYDDISHGPRMLETKLQLEIDKDPMVEWRVKDRYVFPGEYRTASNGRNMTELSFRFERGDFPLEYQQFLRELGDALFEFGEGGVFLPKPLKDRQGSVALKLRDLMVIVKVRDGPPGKKITLQIDHKKKNRKEVLRKLSSLVRARMALHEMDAIPPRAEAA